MTKPELARLLEEFGEMFPRLNQSEVALKFWFNALQDYSTKTVRAAFEKHLNSDSNTPTIASIRALCNGMVGREATTDTFRWTQPYNKIDFCIDMLGLDTVNGELRLIVGPDAKTPLSLCSRKDWVPAYKAKLKEMTEFACALWVKEGKRPTTKWTGREWQEAWSECDIPAFDDDRMFFAKLRISA